MKVILSIKYPFEEISLGNGILLSRDDGFVEVEDSPRLREYIQSGYIETDHKIDLKPVQEKGAAKAEKGKEIWVFAEIIEDHISQVSLELLGKASQLAKSVNADVAAVLLASKDDYSKDLISYGADKVYLIENELLRDFDTSLYTKAIAELAKKESPQILLFGATHIGRDLAPRIARRLDTGLTADCTGLEINEKGELLQTRPAFGGNLMAQILCKRRPQMATVRPGVMQIMPQDTSRTGQVINTRLSISAEDKKTKIQSYVKSDKKMIDLEQAELIIAGGRGLGSKENFEKIFTLANILGAEVGASRAVVEAGWIDKSHLIGQTGKTVKPKVYMAFGISGAIQHTVAIQSSDMIIAVNKDSQAPIFKVADHGFVADANEFLATLIDELQK